MLGPQDQERLALVAADISLVAGEYAANAGDDRALFAVLDGRIETARDVDGRIRVLGELLPGDVFGEVPIVVGHQRDRAGVRRRHFLDRNQISFAWMEPDAPEGAELWGGPLPAEGDCPAVRVDAGKTAIRPQLRRVAELLGLGTEPGAGSGPS